MRKFAIELKPGDNFVVDLIKYTCIRPYGENKDVMAIAENGRIVKMGAWLSVNLVKVDTEQRQLKDCTVGIVLTIPNVDGETFRVLETTNDITKEVTLSVLETGEVTTIHEDVIVNVINNFKKG